MAAESKDGKALHALPEVRQLLPHLMRQNPIPTDPEGMYSKPSCRVASCERISTRPDDLCRPHGNALAKAGLDLEQWLGCAQSIPLHRDTASARGWFDVASAGAAQVRDELAFGLMQRGAKGRRVSPNVLNVLAASLREEALQTLLDLRYDSERIDRVTQRCSGHGDVARALLLDTLDELCLLTGMEPTRRSPGIASAGGHAFTNINSFANQEFKASITRWVDYRTSIELGAPQYLQACLKHLHTFCSWLDQVGVDRWRDLGRAQMIEYLHYLKSLRQSNGSPYGKKYRAAMLSGVAVFIDEATMNGWADIPREARWLRSERPHPDRTSPRLMGKLTASRLRNPEALSRVDNRDIRLAIRVMAETGLRRKDVVAGIQVNCVLELGEDRFSLRYYNSKAKETKTVPIKPELAAAFNEHIAHKRTLYPNNRNLFADNAEDRVLTLTRVNAELTELIEVLDLRGQDGERINVTPHMFRHQNATDWLDAGVPLHAVKELLGHRSIVTTEIYGRISAENLREQWEKSFAVNGAGEVVQSPGSEVAEAAWLHAFTGGAAQALPNGRCGMPCGETCEHANACLFCPLFITGPEYLPVLRDQRDDHAKMIEMATEQGYQRIVDKNTKPFLRLNDLIASLEQKAQEFGIHDVAAEADAS